MFYVSALWAGAPLRGQGRRQCVHAMIRRPPSGAGPTSMSQFLQKTKMRAASLSYYKPLDVMKLKVTVDFDGAPPDIPLQRIMYDEASVEQFTIIAKNKNPYDMAFALGYDVALRLSPLWLDGGEGEEGRRRFMRGDITFPLVMFYKDVLVVRLHCNMMRFMYDAVRRVRSVPLCPSFYVFFVERDDDGKMSEDTHHSVAFRFYSAFVENNNVLARAGGTKLLFAFISTARTKNKNLDKFCQCLPLADKHSFGKLSRDGFYKISKKQATHSDIAIISLLYDAILDYMQYMSMTHYVKYGSRHLTVTDKIKYEGTPFETSAKKVFSHFTTEWIPQNRPDLIEITHMCFNVHYPGKGYLGRHYFFRPFFCIFFQSIFQLPKLADWNDSVVERYVIYKLPPPKVDTFLETHLAIEVGITSPSKRARIYTVPNCGVGNEMNIGE